MNPQISATGTITNGSPAITGLPYSIVTKLTAGHYMSVENLSGWYEVQTTSNQRVAASLTTALSGADNDLAFTAAGAGLAGNGISVAYATGGTAGSETISISGYAVTVTIQSGVSTASQIRSAWNNSAAALNLATCNLAPGNSGAGTCTAMSAAYLADGSDGTVTLDRNYTGASNASATLLFWRDRTPFMGLPLPSPEDRNITMAMRRTHQIIDDLLATRAIDFTATGLQVPANSAVEFNLPGFANAAMIGWVKITQTAPSVTGVFSVEIHTSSAFDGVPTVNFNRIFWTVDLLPPGPFMDQEANKYYRDNDERKELHIKITNTDATHAASYDIEIKGERFR